MSARNIRRHLPRLSLTLAGFLTVIVGVALVAPSGPAEAGAYISSFEGAENRVTHPETYTGTGGVVNISLCISPASAFQAQMVASVQNNVATLNALTGASPNLFFGGSNNIPAGAIDFESVLIHEVGHAIGLAHVNHASESGLSFPQNNGTKSTNGPNNSFNQNDGADNIHGSRDDLRTDDGNLHWFLDANNDPCTAASPGVVDATTMSRDLASLPAGDLFAANADRSVCSALGRPNTEAVMQQGSGSDEDQRRLGGGDVRALRFAMSGIDEIQGTGDDYTMNFSYAGITNACDIPISFDNSVSFAATFLNDTGIAGQHRRVVNPSIRFNTGFNWFFNTLSSVCGDGTVDPGEQCDDGNTTNGDGCDSNCVTEACGNGVVQTGEQCDDGNTNNGDGCSSTCQNEFCGDGVVQGAEQCDDGNVTPGDGCDSLCRIEVCGNGFIQVGEQCDDGNTTSGDGCSATCQLEGCGNGVVDPGEQCDDGNTANGDGCDSNCITETCGNGVVQAGEECDDGNAVDDDACANDCTQNFDPNLLVNGDFSDGEPPWIFFTNGGGNFDVVGGEARIDFTADGSNVQLYQRNIATAGNTEHTLTFRARHTAPNQKIQVRFAMHESPFTFYGLTASVTLSTTMQTYSFDFTTTNDVITDGRLMFLLPRADGVGETFFVDDVVLRLTTPDTCGNGSLDAGESCDGANLGGESCSTQGFDGGTLACNATCDGFVTSSCFVCGDNTINGAETCDGSDLGGESCSTQGFDGGTLGCSPTCDMYDTSGCTICGDGTVDPGEQCDDGNTTSGDGCSAECQLEGCGNGVVDPGEQCDDGNATNGDGCDSACVLEACGNGVVQSGEQCDDGNTTSGDGCDSNCIDEVCGNGIVQSGEQCDDGNTNDNDACSNSCTINATTNVVDNGDFSAGEAPWIFWDNRSGGTFDVVSGEGKVTFGSNSSNVQLYQRGIDADGSTDYTLTFRARHTGSPKRVTVRFALHTSPYTFYGLSQNINLTSTMQTYSVDFTTTNNVITNGRLMFLLSDSDTPTGSMFVVDDVVLAPSSPSTCGNGSLDPGETCDGANLDGESCVTQGFDGGTLSCNATCDGFVTSACTGCGNGVVDPGETCDGANLDGESCITQGFDGGTLSCNATCDDFVTTACSICGDGTVDPGEECDDGNTTSGDGCSDTCQTEGGGTNLVANGDFSSGTSGWSYSSNGSSSFNVTGGEAFINMITPGTNTQLYQPNIVLQPNTTYELTFRGRNTGGDNVRVRVIRHTSPYNNYGLDRVINLTTTMQTFTLTFTTPGGALAPARLMMWMAPYDSAGDDYFFDDFTLTEQ